MSPHPTNPDASPSHTPSHPPSPAAATLWEDQSELFSKLTRRLVSYSPNTQRALAADWRAWRSWCATNSRIAFPASPADIVDYMLAHSPPLQRTTTGELALNLDVSTPTTRRASTVTRWLASLSTLHRIANTPDPTRDEDVKATRRAITRGRNTPEQKAPLRWTDIHNALTTLGNDLRDLRAKALIAVAYSTLARRAELTALRVEDITFTADLDRDGTVTLKTKGGDHKERYLAPEARQALENWLTAADIKHGPIFRRLQSNGRTAARALTPAEVARTFKRIASLIALDSTRPIARISAHSTRIGAAQDLTAAGAALPEIMIAGGWKSAQMPAHYARKLDTRQGAMRRWLESARKKESYR
jgi:integrase/recombinase XerD